jgi:hypothetical protein
MPDPRTKTPDVPSNRRHRMILFAFPVAVFFILAGSAEGFVHHHHHSASEDSDCAYCSFHNAVAQSDHVVNPPQVVPLLPLVFLLAAFFQPFYFARFFSHSGLSPPTLFQ